MQFFPKFDLTSSKLQKIVINDSILNFEKENSEQYSRLEYVEHLDLSYNNIVEITDHFKRLFNLKTLFLKRNSLTSLPYSFAEMDHLTELNLMDNKITIVPNINFSKLVKLNLNMNQLENFTCLVNTNNPPLTYLFLAQNKFKEIPKNIMKFKKLKHVAMDNNQIKEIHDWVRSEMDFKVSISLMNNFIKNKETFTKENNSNHEIINDILNVNIYQLQSNMVVLDLSNVNSSKIKLEGPKEKKKEKESGNKKEKVKENKNESLEEEQNIDPRNRKEMIEMNRIIKSEELNGAKHFIELKIKRKIDDMMKNLLKFGARNIDVFKIEIKSGKQRMICDELRKIIENKQEGEISKFEDFELKSLIKTSYRALNKFDEYKITKELPRDLNDQEKEVFSYLISTYSKNELITTPNEAVSKKDDLNNLAFLNNLKHCLTNSKVNLFLKYLANIDTKLATYLKLAIDDNDINSYILLISELKLFLKELLEYYQITARDLLEVKYEHKVSQNVIHKIFRDSSLIKILYRLGLKEFKIKGTEIAEFIINHSVNEKHKLFENYLGRLIKIIKSNKSDLMIVD